MSRYGIGTFMIRFVTLLVLEGAGCDGNIVFPTRGNGLYCDERTPCTGRGPGVDQGSDHVDPMDPMDPMELTTCDLARHRCVAATVDLAMSPDLVRPECVVSSECPLESPVCEREHCRACVEATDDDVCRRRAAGTPRCGSGGACVACRVESQEVDCGVAAPICRDGACGRCTRHYECATGACAGDGSCEPPDRIFWVDNGGMTAANCRSSGFHDGLSRATAFCDVQSALGAPAPRPIVVIRGGGQDAFTVRAGQVKIIGPGAADGFLPGQFTLRAASMGTPAITFGPLSPAEVTIEDLRFQGGSGAPGILCESLLAPARLVVRNSFVQGGLGEHALALSYGCTATVEDTQVRLSRSGIWCHGCNASIVRTTVAQNTHGVVLDDARPFGQVIPGSLSIDGSTVEHNGDTGVVCQSSGQCTVTNSLIAANGSMQVGMGGIVVAGSGRATIDFDTIVGNVSPGAAAGINCLSSGQTTIANSIVWGNARSSGSQLGSRCLPSLVITGAGDAMGIARDPAFAGPDDFHLRAGDPANRGPGGCCVDRAKPVPGASWADHDRDGARRPRGAAHDIGAYELE